MIRRNDGHRHAAGRNPAPTVGDRVAEHVHVRQVHQRRVNHLPRRRADVGAQSELGDELRERRIHCVEVEGADGSWLILDVSAGCINGVEIAVWPDVRKRNSLKPPGVIEDGHVTVPARKSQPGVAALEVETPLIAEADETERVFHFTLGRPRATRTVRFARDLLLDLDGSNNLAGLWLLNVPPFPSPA